MKTITIQLTEKELQSVIEMMDYVLLDELTSGAKDEDEERWTFDNSILQKLQAAQSQAQGK